MKVTKQGLGFVAIISLFFSIFLIQTGCQGEGSEETNPASGISEFDSVESYAGGLNTKITAGPPLYTDTTTADFKFKCTAAPCKFKCKLDTSAWAKCKSPTSYSGLVLGNHAFQVKARSSGKTDRTPASYTWHIGDIWATTSTSNAPEGRNLVKAVWTGTEMIIWGGYYYDGVHHYLNSGGVYDPATDSWTATSSTNAPSERYGHSVVWADTVGEMIVWGGVAGPSVNTGGRYNPGTDTWTATSTTNAPTARYFHTAVWSGSEMIVWGGYAAGYTDTGGRYNPSGDSWTATATANAPTARDYHTAVWTTGLATPVMIVWGGVDSIGQVNTGGQYNPADNSWTATATANGPDIRFQHSAVWTGTKMIVWGGAINSPSWVYRNTGGVYDPGLDSWTATSLTNAPSARNNHAAVWTGTEMIVWGGASTGILTTGGRYNPTTDSWTATSLTNAPAARTLPGVVWAGNQLIIWGGRGAVIDGARYWP